MKLALVKATTSQNVLIFIQDSSSTTGAGLAGLAWNTASLTGFYYRENQGTGATAITLATATIGTWATGGFVEIDAADMPGWYELGIPDLALATGADFVGIQLKGAANMAQLNLEIQLTNFNVNEGVRGGLTALPNAAADAAGGLVISDAGGLDIDAMNTNVNDIETAADAILVDTGTTIPGTITTLQTDSTLIVADTNELQTDWVDGGRLDLLIDAILLDTGTTIPGTITTLQTDSTLIVADTNELQGDWANGGRLDLIVDAILADTLSLDGTKIPDTLSLANINAEVDTALRTTTDGEPAQGAPGATISIEEKISWLYKAWRNKTTATATQYNLYNDDTTTIDTKATLADDGTTASRTEMVTGP